MHAHQQAPRENRLPNSHPLYRAGACHPVGLRVCRTIIAAEATTPSRPTRALYSEGSASAVPATPPTPIRYSRCDVLLSSTTTPLRGRFARARALPHRSYLDAPTYRPPLKPARSTPPSTFPSRSPLSLDRSINYACPYRRIYLSIGSTPLSSLTAPKSTHFYVFCLVSFVLYAFNTRPARRLRPDHLLSNSSQPSCSPPLLHFAITFQALFQPCTGSPRLVASLLYVPGTYLLALQVFAIVRWSATEVLSIASTKSLRLHATYYLWAAPSSSSAPAARTTPSSASNSSGSPAHPRRVILSPCSTSYPSSSIATFPQLLQSCHAVARLPAAHLLLAIVRYVSWTST